MTQQSFLFFDISRMRWSLLGSWKADKLTWSPHQIWITSSGVGVHMNAAFAIAMRSAKVVPGGACGGTKVILVVINFGKVAVPETAAAPGWTPGLSEWLPPPLWPTRWWFSGPVEGESTGKQNEVGLRVVVVAARKTSSIRKKIEAVEISPRTGQNAINGMCPGHLATWGHQSNSRGWCSGWESNQDARYAS